ncbi:hypothetical protein GON03_22170 [Nocardioides sp. MAH-18]|uniref:Uncharacterized protein n=1 Tax=Nocardioides agri TaxID=2682843 RepID=A0A6L6XZQ3_9ACTN|nr:MULTISPECIES: hypothetical protein [unclassified Nocardioides]MBA2952734.1 hypothetical protein [Nocardioides sp. CGMCC 1.13656]MVQ51896.1 hypothetical protein [Nocardioides sp. MAH-18]
MSIRRRGLSDDSGAMLIIALLIITTVALVTGALLTQGSTSLRATVALRGVAGTSYGADAAAKVAVNNLRLGSKAPGWVTPTFPGPWADWAFTANADGTGCFGADGSLPKNSLELKNLYPRAGDQTADSSARVDCSVVPGTGIFGAGLGVGINDPDPTDAFARALTTVGTTGPWHGMTLKPLGTGNSASMPVRGGIASKSYINVTNGALVTDGYVKAEGACTGAIVSSPAQACNQPGSVPTPTAPDPPLTSVPTYRDASAYSSSCVFQPGFYNNAKALSDAVNGCTTARFSSGKYYFDFRDEERGTGQNTWNITTTLIGGEYVGTSIPGGCKNPILNDPIAGVQFVFGGTSRITVGDAARVELCGPSNGGEPPVTVYQEQSGSTEAAVTLPAASAATADQLTGNVAGDKWTTGTLTPATTPVTSVQAPIGAADASNVMWKVAGNNDDVGVNLRNFAGLSTIPAGADITSATLQVKYVKASLKPLRVTVSTQTPADVTISAPDGTGWGQADIAAQLRALLVGGAFDATKPLLQLRMMDANKDDTLTIDAVRLAVTYVPPSLRTAQDDQIIYAPGGNFHGVFVVQGATFVPKGYVDLDPGSSGTALVAFRWGLVASGVNLKAQPSQQFGYPIVSMPVAGHGLGNKVTVVDLEVYVCVGQSTCASGGTLVRTVRAMITDPPYTAWGSGSPRPEPGRRKVEILSWGEQQ